jgi:nuclear GTP-binding protein
MPKKSKKSKSKRVPLRRKHKIVKKAKEHARKKKREMRKDILAGRKSTPKDPGIPNNYPFKEELIKELDFNRERDRLKKERRKEENKLRRQEDMQRMQQMAESRSKDFEEEKGGDGDVDMNGGDLDNTRGFYRAFNKVVEYADVLIQVLDARDPLGCRCMDVERLVAKKHPNKKIVLLLNKADLVPREVLQKWLKYLRSEHPTLAFKCSTQKQGKNLSQSQKSFKGGADQAKFNIGTESIGAGSLLQLLKNYARNRNLKTAVTVGVIGLPNVGKSSLINSLLRSKSVAVGSTPGVTTNIQEVNLDKHVKLLDCPGIVFSSRQGEVRNALLNAVKIEKLEDPREPVYEIVGRVKKAQLMKAFKIPTFSSPDHFVELVAQTRGKLLKGGLSDTKAAAKLILQDWNVGKIPFYTSPPEREGKGSEQVTVVNSWGQDFNADKIYKDEELSLIAQLESMGTGSSSWIEAKASEPATPSLPTGQKAQQQEEEEEPESSSESMEVEEEDLDRGKGGESSHKQNKVLYSHEGQFNPKLAKAIKKKKKKAKKLAMETDDYDFEQDWES